MKYAIIIPDGAADLPLAELDGLTPLQAAHIPHMDAIAEKGRIGSVANVPEGFPPGSDVATLSLLGYPPEEFYTGRAPLEAAANDIVVADSDWVFRCNLVTIIDDIMEDYCAGHITTAEAAPIIEALQATLADTGVQMYLGVGYRHLLVIPGEMDAKTVPPHDILGQAISPHLPRGQGAEILLALMGKAHDMLAECDINAVRADLGENPATDIWLWGQGKRPTLPNFAERFGKKGAAITAVDLLRGLSKLIGWDLIEVEGATGYYDTNYIGKGQAAVKALDTHDLVLVHVEATDEAGHNADVANKVRALEQIDEHIVAPVLERLQQEGDDWRIMVLPDHPTPCAVRTHTREPVPFAIAGKQIERVISGPYCEQTANESDLHIPKGSNLMEFFLTVR